MLLRFGVENYRSIRDRQELSFVATAYNEGSAIEVPVATDDTLRVSPVAAIYGANASGKSNVLRALAAFQGHLVGDVSSPYEYEPFALGPERDEPTIFDVEFIVDGVRFIYGLVYDAERIREEWLYAYPHGRRQVWFTRDHTRAESLRFPGDHLKGAKILLSESVRENASFLSLGGLVRHPQLTPLVETLRGLDADMGQPRWAALDEWLARYWDDRMTELVRRADLGIEGAEIAAAEGARRESVTGRPPRLRFRHAGKMLPLYTESDGTLRWVRLLPGILRALDRGQLIAIDELDASLHPTLAAEVIRMFRDHGLNAKGAQLLFSSHDVSILGLQLGSPLLDRDQVWFTEKGQDGATELYPLTEAHPRKGENVQLGYLAGRYGARPDLSPGELVRVALTVEDEVV